MNETPLLIVQGVNRILDPVVGPILGIFGIHAAPGHELIPDYLVMSLLVVFGWTVVGLVLRSRLSVDNPGTFQVVLEDALSALLGLLDQWLGPKGRRFLPLIGAFGAFIFVGNYLGVVPGFMAPTANINVTVGCALTAWVYYHLQGVRAHGLVAYLKHFAFPPGVPVALAPMMLVIETISHLSRVLSLSLRLFGNIFGEDMVVAILAGLVPFIVPLPVMVLELITDGLQAFIFVLLVIIYLQGATALEHEEAGHGHEIAEASAMGAV